jgi:hypothetical protein
VLETSFPQLPKKAVLGYVASIDEPKVTRYGNYCQMMVSLEPLNELGEKKKYCFLFHPDWFVPSFNPDKELPKKGGARFIYEKNIYSPNGVAALQAFCGSKEQFREMGRRVMGLEEHTFQAVGAEIAAFIKEQGQQPFIFILKQAMEGTGEYDEKGKEIKLRTRFYEVDSFLRADKDGKRSVQGKLDFALRVAAKTAKETGEEVEPMFQVCFELDSIG